MEKSMKTVASKKTLQKMHSKWQRLKSEVTLRSEGEKLTLIATGAGVGQIPIETGGEEEGQAQDLSQEMRIPYREEVKAGGK